MAPIVIIDALPKFTTPEEHKTLVASTPASFSDIPPVLRHKEENVAITLDPSLDTFGTEDCTRGTLYVIESVLVFMSTSGRGIQVEYPSITLHAISRADDKPSLYCQLDEAVASNEPQGEEEVSDMRELVIVPQNPGSLENIFEALSLCASLHPDPADEDDMDEDDDAFIDADESAFETFNGDAGEELSEVGRAALAHLESIIYNPFEQPEDDNQEPHSNAEDADANTDVKHVNGTNGTKTDGDDE